jgi:polysaccharide biosynthesis transport protein
MTPDNSQETIQSVRVLEMLRRRIWIVVPCLVIGAAAAFAKAESEPLRYSATAALLFQQDDLSQQLFGYPTSSTIDPTTADATYVELAQQPAVSIAVARVLGIPAHRVVSEVTVGEAGTSDVVNITVTDPSPGLATRIANSYAEQFVVYRQNAQRAQILQAADQLQRQITLLSGTQTGRSQLHDLETRLAQLKVLTSLQTGDVQQAQVAQRPTSASGPKTKKDTALGLIVGLLIGLLAAALAERLDQTPRDPDEIRDRLGLPVLGTIPVTRDLSRTASTTDFASNRDTEPFRLLRSQLTYFNVDRKIDSVMITSAAQGDGKTTVAWNLARAAALADSDRKVLLVDADLRAPRISTLAGLARGPGLVEVLTQGLRTADVLHHVDVTAGGQGGSVLHVLTAGASAPNPSELMESQALRDLVSELREQFDFIVFDAAPTSLVSDAIPLLTQVSGVLVVVRVGRTQRAALRRLKDHLSGLNNIRVLGLVLNGMKRTSNSYYYA